MMLELSDRAGCPPSRRERQGRDSRPLSDPGRSHLPDRGLRLSEEQKGRDSESFGRPLARQEVRNRTATSGGRTPTGGRPAPSATIRGVGFAFLAYPWALEPLRHSQYFG